MVYCYKVGFCLHNYIITVLLCQCKADANIRKLN